MKSMAGRMCVNTKVRSLAKCASRSAAGLFLPLRAPGFRRTMVRRVATASPINARKITAIHKNRTSVRFGVIACDEACDVARDMAGAASLRAYAGACRFITDSGFLPNAALAHSEAVLVLLCVNYSRRHRITRSLQWADL